MGERARRHAHRESDNRSTGHPDTLDGLRRSQSTAPHRATRCSTSRPPRATAPSPSSSSSGRPATTRRSSRCRPPPRRHRRPGGGRGLASIRGTSRQRAGARHAPPVEIPEPVRGHPGGHRGTGPDLGTGGRRHRQGPRHVERRYGATGHRTHPGRSRSTAAQVLHRGIRLGRPGHRPGRGQRQGRRRHLRARCDPVRRGVHPAGDPVLRRRRAQGRPEGRVPDPQGPCGAAVGGRGDAQGGQCRLCQPVTQ